VVDVPVPAGSPAAAGATPVLIAPPPQGTGSGTPRPSALPPAPLVLPPAGPLHPGPYRVQPRQRSLSEMANEQLRRGTKPRDPFAESVEGAGIDDCLHAPTNTPTVGGLLAAPGLAARALSGRCAK
jgi:hypothetical protein